MNNPATGTAGMGRSERALLILLIASIFINYIDRGNLSIAAPLIERELSLTPSKVGSLLSAFFWTYALLQLFGLAGWITDRYSVILVFTGALIVWSAATLATGLLSGFSSLYLARLVLGAGESLAYPCYSKIFATHIPQSYRGRANAFLDAGSKLGPALGTFIGGLLLPWLGWRLFFIVLGCVSLLWIFPWLRYARTFPSNRVQVQATRQPLQQMLRLRSAWGTFMGHFCGNYFWFFLLTWVPLYLVKERNLSIRQMADVVSFALASVACATVVAGAVSDRLIARGASITRIRKSVVVGGLLFSSILLPVAFVDSLTCSIVLLVLSCIAFGSYTSNHWAITQTLAGPAMAGRWTGLQNGFGSIAGIIAPMLAGSVVEATGTSKVAFAIAGIVSITGALCWSLVGPVREIVWSTR